MFEIVSEISSFVAQTDGLSLGDGVRALGVGLAVGLAAYGSGYAERGIGAAAVGGLAEDSVSLAEALVMTVLPETLVLLALVLAFVL
jgi:V/A-type H+-transporting ATPase subunit K